MSAQDISDEPEGSTHTLRGLLADLNMPNTTDDLRGAQLQSWTFPSSNRTSPSLNMAGSTTRPTYSQRTSSRSHTSQVPELELTSSTTPTHQPSYFTTPNRSIFSSGPPTSSVSANTAQASMSAPSTVNTSRPLASLTSPSLTASRRAVHYQHESPSGSRSTHLPRAEKDVDDPSGPVERMRSTEARYLSTPAALSKLFTTPEINSPALSRHASYFRTPSGTGYTRASSESAPLPQHLYNRGLLGGKHSDITVIVFGTRYALHRLLLDRAPFFSSALSEPWFESSSKEITLHPEDIDNNITQHAFELALKRLYGCNIAVEEDKEAMGLFATGCWLEMADLIDASVNSILRQMAPSRLASLIKTVTSNYYGSAGERILASAKAMLCREGWEMPLRYWDGIPGEIVREIIGNDGFFVPGEWDRWILAKKVLDRRLKARAIDAGLFDVNGKPKRTLPNNMHFFAIRFDTVYQRNSLYGRQIPEADDQWLGLYTSPDIAALLVLLDEGIHYIHLSFEQLQKIRGQRDILGLPVMPEKVISNALWMQMELRQKVVSANEADMELGLSQVAEETTNVVRQVFPNPGSNHNTNGKGKQPEMTPSDTEDEDMESGSWDGNGKPRKFWIPSSDSNSVIGGSSDATVNHMYANGPYGARQSSRFSASIDPQDVQWASDFMANAADRPQIEGRPASVEPIRPVSYTHYPPFRFAAEFPNPRSLKEKKRVYSRTVWYAGSLWNLYIQKVETLKSTQLGVYLHRAKEATVTEGLIAAARGSVDERIGHLERDMLMRSQHNDHRQHGNTRAEMDDEASGSGGDPDATLVGSSSSRATALSSLLRGDGIQKASQTPGSLTLSDMPDRVYNSSSALDSEDESDEVIETSNDFKVSTLPPYVDGRPTIRTYFKIYSPSKEGRMLSVYESAPDKFNFSQSWGWKSSTMIVDDCLLGYNEGVRSRNGKLRFMVVIGNV